MDYYEAERRRRARADEMMETYDVDELRPMEVSPVWIERKPHLRPKCLSQEERDSDSGYVRPLERGGVGGLYEKKKFSLFWLIFQ